MEALSRILEAKIIRGLPRNFKVTERRNSELEQLKLFGETSFFACINSCRVSPPNLCVSSHFSISYFDFLYIGVTRPSVVFCVCPMLQFTLEFVYFELQ